MVVEHDFQQFPELTNAQLQEFGLVSPHVQYTEDFTATVVKVHDADTITLRTEQRDFDFPLRLLDIDAPELSEEGGREAQEWLEAKILGREIEVGINSKNRVGKYGRLLGKCLFGGLDIGTEMIHLGLVVPFGTRNQDELPDVNKLFRLEQWFGGTSGT